MIWHVRAFRDGSRHPEKELSADPPIRTRFAAPGSGPAGALCRGPAYYCYSVPQPPGIELERVRPEAAAWNPQLSEFILMYEDVRSAAAPDEALYQFLESTFEAAARLAKWPVLSPVSTDGMPGSNTDQNSPDPNDSAALRDQLKGHTTEHAAPPRLEDEGQSGG